MRSPSIRRATRSPSLRTPRQREERWRFSTRLPGGCAARPRLPPAKGSRPSASSSTLRTDEACSSPTTAVQLLVPASVRRPPGHAARKARTRRGRRSAAGRDPGRAPPGPLRPGGQGARRGNASRHPPLPLPRRRWPRQPRRAHPRDRAPRRGPWPARPRLRKGADADRPGGGHAQGLQPRRAYPLDRRGRWERDPVGRRAGGPDRNPRGPHGHHRIRMPSAPTDAPCIRPATTAA